MREGERGRSGGGVGMSCFWAVLIVSFYVLLLFCFTLLSLSFAFVSLSRVFSRTCVSGRFGYRRWAEGNPSPILCMEARAVFY